MKTTNKLLLTAAVLSTIAAGVNAEDITLKDNHTKESNYNLVSTVGNVKVDSVVPKNENTVHNVILGGWSKFTGTNIYNILSGTELKTSGRNVENIIMGDALKVQDSAYGLILGNTNTVENDEESIKKYGRNSVMIKGGHNTVKNSPLATVLGEGTTVTNSYGVFANGKGIVAENARWSVVMGEGASIKLPEAGKGSSIVIGAKANTNNYYTVSLGAHASTTAYGATAIGGASVANGKYSLAMAQGTANGYGAIAIGMDSKTDNDYAVAIGNKAKATGVGSMALGDDSVADRLAGTVGYLAEGKDDATWKSTKSALSVGDRENNVTRQITGLAAGTEDTDAVNVAQLKVVEAEAKKHSSVIAGDNTTVTTGTNAAGGVEYKVAVNKDLNEMNSVNFGKATDDVRSTVTKDGARFFNGSENIGVTSNGIQIENTDTLDQAKFDKTGMYASEGNKTVYYTTAGISAGDQIINNVKAGVKDTDAVNVKQLNDSVSTESVVADSRVDNIASVGVLNGKSTGDKNAQYGVYVSRTAVDAIAKGSNRFAGDDVIKVERWVAPSNVADLTTFKYDGNKAATKTPLTYKANGVTKTTMLADGLDFTNGSNTTASVDANGVVKYDLNKDITVDSVKAGKVVADKANIGGVTIDNSGINAGGKTITNVARGVNANDAATVGQLNDVRTAMANGDAATLNRANAYTDSRVSETTAQNAALAALHPLDFNKHDKFQIATGVGNYKNKTSVALGAFYQPNENTLLSLGATLGAHRNVVNAGATFRFGKHSEMNTDRHDALENKVKTLEETLANISAKYDELLKKVEEK
jgi:hypothetical protein